MEYDTLIGDSVYKHADVHIFPVTAPRFNATTRKDADQRILHAEIGELLMTDLDTLEKPVRCALLKPSEAKVHTTSK